MGYLRGRCSTLFYRYASVYGNQWKICAWMATPDRSPHRWTMEDFYSSERSAVSQDDTLLPNEGKKRTKERTSSRAFQSVYEIPTGGGEIQFGGEFAPHGPALAWHSTTIRVHALCWNVKWAGAAHDGKLIWIHVRVNFRHWRACPPRTFSIAFALGGNLMRKNSREFVVSRDLSSRL